MKSLAIVGLCLAGLLFAAAPRAGIAAPASAKPAFPNSGSEVQTNREFIVFAPARWHPAAAPPGGWQENVAFGLFVAAPFVCFALLAGFMRRLQRKQGPTRWGRLAVGNALVFLCLGTPLLLAGEIYFRFCYDTTDSLAYTRASERWIQRHWRVNQAGCRDDRDYSPALTPGKRRISFVGDSFTAGHGISDVEDRFPNIVRRAHPEWEIHVLARQGLDTGGELALMRKLFARGYQAQQVVLVYCLNDVGDLLPVQAEATLRTLDALDQSCWLVRNSYMLNLWYYHYRAARDPYLRNYFPFVREAYRGPIWEQQQERLKAFRDLVQAHGAQFAVVTFPFLHALGPNYEYRFVHETLNQFWLASGVPHLDLLPVFTNLPPARITVNRFDAHPNEYANQLAAAAIGNWLQHLSATNADSR
jgi:hypothetical protein